MAERVALVDDEEPLLETVGFALERAGYRVQTYPDGQAAWEAFERELPDLVVLDIVMPRLDGLELCRRLRGLSARLPIIFLTSRDEELDRVLGLELGADDYLCKPFSMRELMARVKVLFRRLALDGEAVGSGEEAVRHVGRLSLDPLRHQVCWDAVPIVLTVSEFRILEALARRPGHVKSRAQLLQDGYPDDAWVSERTVDSHIKRMRRKFAEVDPDFDAIETLYGVGYRYRAS